MNNTKFICQLYVPSIYRSYGKGTLSFITDLLPDLKTVGFWGIYLIALWKDGGQENGFDIVSYDVNPKFGTNQEFKNLIAEAHQLGLNVGVDVVPNHVSDQHPLAKNCLAGVSGYEDALYVVSRKEAERLTQAGVPNFFGQKPYSDFGDKWVRSTFLDYHQLNLNWNSPKVQAYHRDVFKKLRQWGVDFVRIDCGMMLHENVEQADPVNPLACLQPAKSVAAIQAVAGDMPLFFEWFDPASTSLFDGKTNAFPIDCSYVITGQIDQENWGKNNLIPLLGGHDQMTARDRGIDVSQALAKMKTHEYAFIDIQTLVGWRTNPGILPGDAQYDSDLGNINQRYRARRPFRPIIEKFRAMLETIAL